MRRFRRVKNSFMVGVEVLSLSTQWMNVHNNVQQNPEQIIKHP